MCGWAAHPCSRKMGRKHQVICIVDWIPCKQVKIYSKRNCLLYSGAYSNRTFLFSRQWFWCKWIFWLLTGARSNQIRHKQDPTGSTSIKFKLENSMFFSGTNRVIVSTWTSKTSYSLLNFQLKAITGSNDRLVYATLCEKCKYQVYFFIASFLHGSTLRIQDSP